MARPELRTAAKDYPDSGIKRGDKYWFVSIKTGPRSSRVMRQLTPFKPSQLTSSAYLSALYDWEEDKGQLYDMDNAQEFADRIRELGDEQRDKYDNMPEGLQQGDSGQMLEARADACEQAASEIEDVISDWESALSDFENAVGEYLDARVAYQAAVDAHEKWEREEPDEKATEEQHRQWAEAEPEVPDESDLPEHTADGTEDDPQFDADEFLDQVRNVEVSE